MRVIKLIITVILMIGVVLLALANRAPVTVQLLPEQLQQFLPFQAEITLPLFFILIGAILVGLLLGYLIEYLRERKYRVATKVTQREKRALEHEVAELKKKTNTEEDEVLALLNT